MKAIKASQAVPLLLPIDIDKEDVEQITDCFDGFYLQEDQILIHFIW